MEQSELDVIQHALAILDSHMKAKGVALQSPAACPGILAFGA